VERIFGFDAAVIVTLDADAMAGRPGYRTAIMPNHRIPGPGNRYFMGALFFDDRQLLKPGESTTARGKFIVNRSDLPRFQPGLRWEICERDKVVGTVELMTRGEAIEVPASADILGTDREEE
jgi:hypothetical protein